MRPPVPPEPVEIPDEVVAPEVVAPAARRRTHRLLWIWALVVVLVLAAVAAPIVWWQVTARTYTLHWGGATAATGKKLTAGGAVEYCTVATSGAKFEYVFSVYNAGRHSVTITSVDHILEPWAQTVDIQSGDQSGGGDDELTHLPVTLAAKGSLAIYLTLRVPGELALQPGLHVYTGFTVVHFRVLGTDRTQTFRFGSLEAPQFVGLDAPDATDAPDAPDVKEEPCSG